MLTITVDRPAAEAPAVDTAAGYWCEWCWVSATGTARTLAAAPMLTPRLAIRWARERACVFVAQLDPPVSWAIIGWTQDLAERWRALHRLMDGEEYILAFPEDGSYVLTVRPVSGDQPPTVIGGGS